MPKGYTCVKKITFVNFWFRQLGQYGGWVCCSNERVNCNIFSCGTVVSCSSYAVQICAINVRIHSRIVCQNLDKFACHFALAGADNNKVFYYFIFNIKVPYLH